MRLPLKINKTKNTVDKTMVLRSKMIKTGKKQRTMKKWNNSRMKQLNKSKIK